jgi:dipeptidyl aminopeptidase/acylaminoacyl peptidase
LLSWVCLPVLPYSMQLFSVEHLFQLEQFGRYFGGGFSFSPNGTTLAFVLQRSQSTTQRHQHPFLHGNNRAEIWLVELPSGQPFQLTNGEADDAGYWAPAWSPDGQRLAMLSTKTGGITLWVWEKAANNFKQLTSRSISFEDVLQCPYCWATADTLLCALLPEGEQPKSMAIETAAMVQATQVWQTAAQAQKPTFSILHSGTATDLALRSQRQLCRINAMDNHTEVLTTAPIYAWQPSPNHKWISVLQLTDVFRPQPAQPLKFGVAYQLSLQLVSVAQDKLLQPECGQDVILDSLHWSSNSQQLAFIGYEGRGSPPGVYVLDLNQGSLNRWGHHGLNPMPAVRQTPQMQWVSANELLVYAAFQTASASDNPYRSALRRDWWLLRRDGSTTSLTETMATAPAELIADVGRQSFVGLAAGQLWRIWLDGSNPENLNVTALSAVVFPNTAEDGMIQTAVATREFNALIVSAEVEQQTQLYWIDLANNSSTRLPLPSSQATFIGYDAQSDILLFLAKTRDGTVLWLSPRTAPTVEPVLKVNLFLQDIVAATVRSIDYQSLKGESLKARLLLPPNQAQCSYPLVVWVYPGSVISSASELDQINDFNPFNLQLLAAQGYAVLQPSMPLNLEGAVDDPMLRLTEGVLPAIDQAIALGIADPDRLFLMGHSFGGYATYGLITQTHRFKAAVAIAGFCNLTSLYGVFDARLRYDEFAHEDLFLAALLESSQLHMGTPPWEDLERYLCNSPLFAIEQVQTPLMIIQGDMDYVPIQQGEEFFQGLYRLGKRADFVRYWGEGHVLSSPANIKDMWQRILSWFESFLEVLV